MNILILGSGGREHTLAWKIAQSNQCENLYVAPGNAGTATTATNLDVDIMNFEEVKNTCLAQNIDMVVVGPEAPLVEGIHDYFLANETLRVIPVIGPHRSSAALEGSKEFAKKFMARHDIPTAAYKSFTKSTLQEGKAFLESLNPPYVLKADGLAAGKGVLILDELQTAKDELEAMLADEKFGAASTTVVIEEFLDGIELSCFVLTNGKQFKILPMAKDYKRIGEGDTGLNTGGMGAVSPVPFADGDFRDKILKKIVIPTVEGLEKDQLPYTGFIFIGLIKVGDEPYVIEYNVRMGDPETEVVLPRIKSDLLELLLATARGTLDEVALEVDPRFATTVMAVSGGYPEAYEKNKGIHGLDRDSEALVFHAGTKQSNGTVVTNGGRVLSVTGYGSDLHQALESSYDRLRDIEYEGMYYRKDIGKDLM